jgi:hypothetical protein
MTLRVLFPCLLIAFGAGAQSYNGPESVVYDSSGHRYLVSNNGSNQILARDSGGALTVFTSAISSGPHGLEIVGNTLFACDGAFLKGFDLATGATVMNLNVGATFLNGICTNDTDFIYVTDFSAKKIFKINIAAQTYSVFVSGLVKSPNGIIYDAANQRIVWVTWGSNAPIMQAQLADSAVSQVTATSLGNCDGIVRDGAGNYYVSAWGTQSVYRFDNTFSTTPVAVVTGLSSPADIYYNLYDDSLVCPNAGNNTVTFHYLGSPAAVDEGPAPVSSVYPNPVRGRLTIDGVKWPITGVVIYNALGEIVLHRESLPAASSRITLDVSGLLPGFYWLELASAGRSVTQQIVVAGN